MTRRHRTRISYPYSGDASYNWKYKPPTTPCLTDPSCFATPGEGTVNEPVWFTTDLGSSPGFSYAGTDASASTLGDISINCLGIAGLPTVVWIDYPFDIGGYSKRLRKFAGTEGGSGDSRRTKWSLHGSN